MSRVSQSLYCKEEIESMFSRLYRLDNEFIQLIEAWGNVTLNEESMNYLTHGFMRRLDTLKHSIVKIFELCNPETEKMDRDKTVDTTIYLQAFIFNAFGAIDNLCHIINIQLELGIQRQGVGFGKNYNKFWNRLDAEFRSSLQGHQEWFEYLENYRHALSHRIPLYIPPKTISNEDAVDHQNLENLKADALDRLDFDEYDELDLKQDGVGRFHPYMTHSFLESHYQIAFHVQVLEDWAKIVSISEVIRLRLQRV